MREQDIGVRTDYEIFFRKSRYRGDAGGSLYIIMYTLIVNSSLSVNINRKKLILFVKERVGSYPVEYGCNLRSKR